MRAACNEQMGVFDVRVGRGQVCLTAAAPAILRAVNDGLVVWVRVAGSPGSAAVHRDEADAIRVQQMNLFEAPSWLGRLERLLTRGDAHV